MPERLSICYAAPGQNLLPTAGPTRNVLSVAEAMSEWADVTVAFRDVLVSPESPGFRVIAIEPGASRFAECRDDTATRGFHPVRHLAYCRRLLSFARQCANEYDVVLEKGWRLSGYLSAAFLRVGVPAALVENAVGLWLDPVGDVQALGKYVVHRAAVAVTNACCRRLPLVIAETQELKDCLVKHRGIRPDRVDVIGLGLDHRLFRPLDQQQARNEFQIDAGSMVIVYVGGLDEYHDLEPVIDALGRMTQSMQSTAELHVVGNGEYRGRLEARAASAAIHARFYGHVPHAAVPRYIAAADVCIAPYQLSAFHDNVLTFSTLKIPEYMACARPVISVPSPAIARLISEGETGFIFPNDRASWEAFLRRVPSRERLASMGKAAADAAEPITWRTTARQYFEACERLADPLSAKAASSMETKQSY